MYTSAYANNRELIRQIQKTIKWRSQNEKKIEKEKNWHRKWKSCTSAHLTRSLQFAMVKQWQFVGSTRQTVNYYLTWPNAIMFVIFSSSSSSRISFSDQNRAHFQLLRLLKVDAERNHRWQIANTLAIINLSEW